MLVLVTSVATGMFLHYYKAYKAVMSGESAVVALGGVDNRIANYTETKIDMQPVNYSFTSYNECTSFNAVRYFDRNVYSYYKGLDRYYEPSYYSKYVLDEHNLEAVAQVVSLLQECKLQAGYSDYELALEAINFVQKNIEYRTDMDTTGQLEYPRYPIETLMEGCGDCEDTSILLAAILKKLDYSVILLAYEKHMAVGVCCDESSFGSYYEYNGKKYFYVETTANGWRIGDVPPEYANMQAMVIEIN